MNQLPKRLANWVASTHPALLESRVHNALRRNMPRVLKDTSVPGVQFAMMIGDRTPCTFSCGVASTSRGQAMTNATRFRVASLSKPFAALVALRAAAAGILSLDGHIPELQRVPALRGHPNLDHIALRHLLAHSSGVADQHGPHLDEHLPRPSLTDLVTAARDDKLRFESSTGHRSVYSGMNYALAEWVIGERLGEDFAATAARFLPGRGIDFELSSRTAPGVATEHDQHGHTLPHCVPVSLAASGMVGCAADIAAVMHHTLRTAHGAVRDSALPRDVASQMFTPHRTELPPTFSLGLHRMKRTSIEVWDHAGHRPGLRCSLNVLPAAQVTVVVLTNGERGQEVIEPVLSMLRAICGCAMAGTPQVARKEQGGPEGPP